MELFRFQYDQNEVYRKFCEGLNTDPGQVTQIEKIPFLPISAFRSHIVATTSFEPEAVFESSGTTQSTGSKHFIRDLALYRKSFQTAFRHFYGPVEEKCILGLLPSYLERGHSSLVMMVDELIKQSGHELSGFYLHDHEKLHRTLQHNELLKIPTLLIGVTYALLDFAEAYPMRLRTTTVMETGGMKGRRKEMTRMEVHRILQGRLGLSLIHSEYGMTELLSQAYSKGDGIFHCPGWMRICLRDEDDPLLVRSASGVTGKPMTGAINCIDLANIYSCAFIATDDMGKLYENGSFEVLGRLDNSEARGCSLMAI
ncbi:MAG: acyl transferase [Chitinophagaceae bacterium]|nr:acyl transferase [Chitinophagaceae bacterium]MBL0056548.1 acyl transferase [Chitinophagaceae bacterium]